MYHAGADGRIIYANARYCEITGLTPQQVLGDFWEHIKVHDEDLEHLLQTSVETIGRGREMFASFRLCRPDGATRWVHARAAPLWTDSGEPAGVIGSLADVTDNVIERRAYELTLERRAAQRSVLVELGQHALAGHDPSELIDEATKWVAETLDAHDCQILEFVSETHDLRRCSASTAADEASPASSATSLAQAAIEAEDQHIVASRGAAVVIGDHGAPWGAICVSRLVRFTADDVQFLRAIANVLATAINRKRVDSALVHQALHDALTGLPNRALLLDRLKHALARARRNPGSVAVLFLDLDHFKVVNDGLGHSAGDDMLRAIARRLEQVVRPGDTIARFGGDEFVVICEDIPSEPEIIDIVMRVQTAINKPILLGEREVFPTASIGIARSREPSDAPESLVASADAAMYRAKEQGRDGYEIFDEHMRSESVSRFETHQALHRALERDELRVHFQPIVKISAREPETVIGAEALLRWQHPDRGLILPGEFIRDAEESGLIRTFGAWVLAEACGQALRWNSKRSPGVQIHVSVNLSQRQLADPNLIRTVRAALENARALNPSLLQLEITESTIMDDPSESLATLAALKDLGVSLAIDDFGTGYSSLSYLKRLPVDALKIDRSFVDGLGTDPDDSAITNAIVSLANALGLDVIAEGIETPDQLAELRELNCTMAQGFLFSPAQPPAELEAMLEAGAVRVAPQPEDPLDKLQVRENRGTGNE